jgi:hypothetical protein
MRRCYERCRSLAEVATEAERTGQMFFLSHLFDGVLTNAIEIPRERSRVGIPWCAAAHHLLQCPLFIARHFNEFIRPRETRPVEGQPDRLIETMTGGVIPMPPAKTQIGSVAFPTVNARWFRALVTSPRNFEAPFRRRSTSFPTE